MKIVVTQDHIEKGDMCSETTCPIALAATGMFPHARHIRVLYHALEVWESSKVLIYTLPTYIQEWILSFDLEEEVHPISFDISNPREILR